MRALLWVWLLSLWVGADTLIYFDCLPRDHQAAVFVSDQAEGRWTPLTADSRQHFRLPESHLTQRSVRFRLSRQGYQDYELIVPVQDLRSPKVRLPSHLDQLITLQPALTTVTFQTRPGGAQTYLQLPGGQQEYLGLSGRPLTLNLAKVTGGSQQGLFYVEFRKSGYSSLKVPIPSYSLVSGQAVDWPRQGVIPLPRTGWQWYYALPLVALLLLWKWPWRKAMRNTTGVTPRLGGYDILQRVGSGASGTVYQARLKSGTLCAIKVLHPHWADDAQVAGQFLREGAILAQFQHPNIVAVYDWGEDLGRPYLVTEWLEGRDLRQALVGDALGGASLGRLLAQAAAGLAAAHAAGVVHRDVKPENLVVREGRACWIDFGLAQPTLETSDLSGTPGYLAPERLNGSPATPASDQYSLGVLAFEALTGTLPQANDGGIAAVLKELRPGLDPQLVEVVERMLAIDPEARFPGLEQVQLALMGRC